MAGTYAGGYHGTGDFEFASETPSDSHVRLQQRGRENVQKASNGGRNTVVSADGRRVLHQGTMPAKPQRSDDIARPTGRVESPLPGPAPLTPRGPAGSAFRGGWGSQGWTFDSPALRNSQFQSRQGFMFTPANNTGRWGWQSPFMSQGSRLLAQGGQPGMDMAGWMNTASQLRGTSIGVNPVQPDARLAGYQSVLRPGTQQMPAPQSKGGTYTIKAGDTLSSIAARLGTTVNALKTQNGIENVNQIYAGTQLKFNGNVSSYAGGSENSAVSAINNATDPEGYFAAIRAAESGGDDNAKNPKSSASGRYQFTKGTWKDLIRQNPDAGLTEDGRFDPDQQEIAIRLFTAQNDEILSNAGIETSNANRYAAHFLGAGSAKTVLRASDDTMMSDLVTDEVLAANSFLRNMDVGEFRRWTKRKTG